MNLVVVIVRCKITFPYDGTFLVNVNLAVFKTDMRLHLKWRVLANPAHYLTRTLDHILIS